jgi:sec-independent protein translocase protein TatC
VKSPFRRAATPKASTPDDRMTLYEHLAELRTRIIRAVLAAALGMIVVLTFYDQILRFLTKPYRNLCADESLDLPTDCRLFSLGPLEGFSTRLKISMYGGLVLALPVVLWQIWRFVVPALHAKEKRYAVPFIISSVVLFALGGYIAYWTLDKALEFLITWSGEDVTQQYQVSKYVSLVGLMVAAFGIGFLFPVLLVFLQLVGVITPRTLLRGWRYAIMAVFVIAAVITPSGDPISMLALAIPMTLFYLISVLIGFWFERRKRRAGALA